MYGHQSVDLIAINPLVLFIDGCFILVVWLLCFSTARIAIFVSTLDTKYIIWLFIGIFLLVVLLIGLTRVSESDKFLIIVHLSRHK